MKTTTKWVEEMSKFQDKHTETIKPLDVPPPQKNNN